MGSRGKRARLFGIYHTQHTGGELALCARIPRELRGQCAATNTSFFLKQLGGQSDKYGGPKALLDGVRHREFPNAGEA